MAEVIVAFGSLSDVNRSHRVCANAAGAAANISNDVHARFLNIE
jgi:hypothetical protein